MSFRAWGIALLTTACRLSIAVSFVPIAYALMLLRQVIELLIMRHDALQGTVAGIGIGLAAIERRHRPGRVAAAGIDRDDHHPPRLLAICEVAQRGGDQLLDLGFGLRELVHDLGFAGFDRANGRDSFVVGSGLSYGDESFVLPGPAAGAGGL
jgi:hypothetical protein